MTGRPGKPAPMMSLPGDFRWHMYSIPGALCWICGSPQRIGLPVVVRLPASAQLLEPETDIGTPPRCGTQCPPAGSTSKPQSISSPGSRVSAAGPGPSTFTGGLL